MSVLLPSLAAPCLQAQGVSVAVPQRQLCSDLSLTVQPGERWCVIGPNGAGKTRLIETLVGLHRPAAGHLRYGGVPLVDLPPRAAARWRAFLPQHCADPFDACVFDVAAVGRHPYRSRGGWSSDEDRARVLAALRRVELAHLADRSVHSLSGGERQRLALAAVLAQETSLLLLDEPLNHLDLRQQDLVLSLLADLVNARTAGLLCSMHDLDLVERFATHVILLDGRGGVASGTLRAVMRADLLSAAFGTPVRRRVSSDAGGWSSGAGPYGS